MVCQILMHVQLKSLVALTHRTKLTVLVGIYRPPSVVANDLQQLKDSLSDICDKEHEIVIDGDFNICFDFYQKAT